MTKKEKKELALQIRKEIESRKIKPELTEEEKALHRKKYNELRMRRSVGQNRNREW